MRTDPKPNERVVFYYPNRSPIKINTCLVNGQARMNLFESKRRMCWVLFPQAIGAPNANLALGRRTGEQQPKLLGRY
jgi:hypothetical protein